MALKRKAPDEKHQLIYIQKAQEYLKNFVSLRQLELNPPPGFVYYAVDSDLAFVKIGYSGQPLKRIGQIKGYYDRTFGLKLFLWGYYPGLQRYCLRTGTPCFPLLLIEQGCHLLFVSEYAGDTSNFLTSNGYCFRDELFRLEGKLQKFVLEMPRWEPRSRYPQRRHIRSRSCFDATNPRE